MSIAVVQVLEGMPVDPNGTWLGFSSGQWPMKSAPRARSTTSGVRLRQAICHGLRHLMPHFKDHRAVAHVLV